MFIWEVTPDITSRGIERWEAKIKHVLPVATRVHSHWEPLVSSLGEVAEVHRHQLQLVMFEG